MESNVENKLNKKNTIIIFTIYFFIIVFTIFYILWVYYGSQAYQCTVSDNPYCQRLICDKYDITQDVPNLLSQPDPQNQYVSSLFFTLSMQSASSDPSINGYEFGYCTDKKCGTDCKVNINCYDSNKPLPESKDINNDENGPFKQLTVNVMHNNLLSQVKYMCEKIVNQNELDIELKDICKREFGDNLENLNSKNTVSFLNKKLLENIAIITNFNYYTFNNEALNIQDSSNLLTNTTNNSVINLKTCLVRKCIDVYPSEFANDIEILYGSSENVLKPTDNCSKCNDNNTQYQYKIYLENTTINQTNVSPYVLYPIDRDIKQLIFL